MSLTRVFISAEISNKDKISKIQQELLACPELDSANVKKVEGSNFHFTLVFIGEVDSASLDQISSIVSNIRFSPIELNFAKIGGFPNTTNARIGWVGIKGIGQQKMSEMVEDIGHKLSSFLVKEKSRYVPHITLFRLKKGSINLESLVANHNLSIDFQDKIEEINLKSSILTPLGPRYSDIVTVKGL